MQSKLVLDSVMSHKKTSKSQPNDLSVINGATGATRDISLDEYNTCNANNAHKQDIKQDQQCHLLPINTKVVTSKSDLDYFIPNTKTSKSQPNDVSVPNGATNVTKDILLDQVSNKENAHKLDKSYHLLPTNTKVAASKPNFDYFTPHKKASKSHTNNASVQTGATNVTRDISQAQISNKENAQKQNKSQYLLPTNTKIVQTDNIKNKQKYDFIPTEDDWIRYRDTELNKVHDTDDKNVNNSGLVSTNKDKIHTKDRMSVLKDLCDRLDTETNKDSHLYSDKLVLEKRNAITPKEEETYSVDISYKTRNTDNIYVIKTENQTKDGTETNNTKEPNAVNKPKGIIKNWTKTKSSLRRSKSDSSKYSSIRNNSRWNDRADTERKHRHVKFADTNSIEPDMEPINGNNIYNETHFDSNGLKGSDTIDAKGGDIANKSISMSEASQHATTEPIQQRRRNEFSLTEKSSSHLKGMKQFPDNESNSLTEASNSNRFVSDCNIFCSSAENSDWYGNKSSWTKKPSTRLKDTQEFSEPESNSLTESAISNRVVPDSNTFRESAEKFDCYGNEFSRREKSSSARFKDTKDLSVPKNNRLTEAEISNTFVPDSNMFRKPVENSESSDNNSHIITKTESFDYIGGLQQFETETSANDITSNKPVQNEYDNYTDTSVETKETHKLNGGHSNGLKYSTARIAAYVRRRLKGDEAPDSFLFLTGKTYATHPPTAGALTQDDAMKFSNRQIIGSNRYNSSASQLNDKYLNTSGTRVRPNLDASNRNFTQISDGAEKQETDAQNGVDRMTRSNKTRLPSCEEMLFENKTQ